MILRKPAPDSLHLENSEEFDPYADTPSTWRRKAPLRWQLALVTAAMVALAVGVMTVVAYMTVSSSLTHSMDGSLQTKSKSLLSASIEPQFLFNQQSQIAMFQASNPDVHVTLIPAGSMYGLGDNMQPNGEELEVLRGDRQSSLQTVGEERRLAMRSEYGSVVILSQSMTQTYKIITSLGTALLIIGFGGVLIAIASGIVVATAGLRPVSRLQRAVEHVTHTDDLRPISVIGNDELAQLTRSFNEMLAALQASRVRQTQLVADAGHELKTPLTSLRTNIELLMMINRTGGAKISEEDRADLERDVVAQIEELSTLIGDLVDLAREDGPKQVEEDVDLEDCLETSLERVQRRRPDVTFNLVTQPWQLTGDLFALGRATLNLMDNAAKWSPPNGVVRIRCEQVGNQMEITFADSGPGIPEEDREKVFERFYRSVQARSMPGSGLGLSIVQQVIVRHGGTISVGESDDGGALMRVLLPGWRPEGAVTSRRSDDDADEQPPADASDARQDDGAEALVAGSGNAGDAPGAAVGPAVGETDSGEAMHDSSGDEVVIAHPIGKAAKEKSSFWRPWNRGSGAEAKAKSGSAAKKSSRGASKDVPAASMAPGEEGAVPEPTGGDTIGTRKDFFSQLWESRKNK